ncbi:hypothetical protein B0H11DRAFT_1904901 [Mycena galericulata]|nr:hypothetical protein B0H11DRAFT_1904901 [Mycena galericulata]
MFLDIFELLHKYGGPDALLFPPRKFAFFGIPARDFGSLITSICFARTACSAPREFGNRVRDFESPRARKFEVPYFAGKDWQLYYVVLKLNAMQQLFKLKTQDVDEFPP